jgi:hypothetical protein
MTCLRKLFLAWGFILSGGILRAYTEVPALLHLDISKQQDTFGFNLTAKLPAFLYSLIEQEQISLWDSPKKRVRISRESLAAIEKGSGTEMSKTHHLFLYELWSSTRNQTNFVILGFGFVNDGKSGKVSYGYIDAQEAFPFLVKSAIEVNVNGPSKLSYWQAVTSRRYHYNLVQFGKKNFETESEKSFQIRDHAFSAKKEIQGLYHIPNNKNVQYFIEPDPNDSLEIGHEFFLQIQTYLNNNREILLNIGGSRYYDYRYRSEAVVTRIEINETWTKTRFGFVQYDINAITIFINNRKLDPISLDLLMGFGILYQFKTAEDVLKEKKFRYVLTRMNNTLISEYDSEKYLKALTKYSWTQVSNYVKFFN